MAAKAVRVGGSGYRFAQLVEHEGCIAQFAGETFGSDRPTLTLHLRVSTIPVSEAPHAIGQVPWSPPGSSSWSGVIRTMHGGQQRIACEGWRAVDVVREIKPPRDGREYGWRWYGQMGEWLPDSFPRCAECGRYHKPGPPYCECCGTCHAGAVSDDSTCAVERKRRAVA